MNEPRISVDDLRVFLAVARTQNVTAAAAAIHLSQPAASRALGRLEHEMGTRLFDRPGQRVRLNAFGQLLVERAQRIVAEVDEARTAIARLQDPRGGLVRVGFLASLGTWLVPRVLSELRRLAPAAEPVLRQGPFDAVAALLERGDVDLLLTSPRPRTRSSMNWHPLGREPLELVVPPGHPLARRSAVRLAEVATEPFIVFSAATEFRSISDGLCHRAGFSPRAVLETDEVATARALVDAGLGVAILPARNPPLAVAPPALAIADRGASRPYGVAWMAGRSLPPSAEALRAGIVSSTRDGLLGVERPLAEGSRRGR